MPRSSGPSTSRPLPPTPGSATGYANPAPPTSGPNKVHKIRVSVLCARSLAKRDLFRLPDPFVKVTVETGGDRLSPGGGHSLTGQIHCTETVRNTLDPKWNAHYDLLLRPSDAVVVSVWNERKVKGHSESGNGKRPSSDGFLGCVRLLSNAIERLKDTGFQRLDLTSDHAHPVPVKGQIVLSLLSRDGHGTGKIKRDEPIRLIESVLNSCLLSKQSVRSSLLLILTFELKS